MEREMHDKQEIRTIWSVLRDPRLRLPVILVCALQGGQQLSGINAVFFYSVRIFKSAGVPAEDAEYANLGAGCINLFVAFFSPILMRKVNRRPLSKLSCAGSCIFLVVLTFVINFIELADWLPYACIAAVFLYLIFYQLGLGPIPYFIGSGEACHVQYGDRSINELTLSPQKYSKCLPDRREWLSGVCPRGRATSLWPCYSPSSKCGGVPGSSCLSRSPVSS